MHRLLSTVVALLATSAAASTQDLQSFRDALRAVTKQLDAGAADDARIALDAVLERHENADYAKRARLEIQRLDQRCRFLQGYDQPTPKSIVHGNVRSLDMDRGRIDVDYTNADLHDFRPSSAAKKSASEKMDELIRGLLKSDSSFHWHQAVFKDFRLTIEGPVYQNARIVVGRSANELLQISVGEDKGMFYRPTQVLHVVGDTKKELVLEHWGNDKLKKRKKRGSTRKTKSSFPMQSGEPFKIDVIASSRSIRVKYNGRSVASATTKKRAPGRLGIGLPSIAFEKIRIRGTFDTAWIQQQIDTHRQIAFNTFKSTYRPEDALPAWIFGEDHQAQAKTAKPFPAGTRPADIENYNRLVKTLSLERFDLLRSYLEDATDEALPPPIKDYLRASMLRRERKFAACLEACDNVFGFDPEFAPVHAIRGEVFAELGRTEEADTEFAAAIRLDPSCERSYSGYAMHALKTRRLELARTVLDSARAAGITGEGFEQLAAMVLKVRLGPTWPRKFEIKTKSYRIASDIDEEVCEDAAQILEGALRHFQSRVGRLPEHEGPRFQVYIFSGQSGFRDYCDGLTGNVPVHTAGLYSPLLKQLLIWNLPNREDTLRTIRHEGFHQYFDALAPKAPPWMHEGMAEYFEQSRNALAGPSDGPIQKNHVVTLTRLRRKGQLSIEKLMRTSGRNFYAKSATNYALSWALIHHLRRGSRPGKKFLEALIAGLKAGRPYDEVLDHTIAGVNLEELQAGMIESIEKMSR